MTATQISALLAARHTDNVFVPECKMGSAGSRTLDGWALLSTWSPLTTIGYEIKVSRSDWLQDQKFEEYRSVCHLFFVVAPKAIVRTDELPPGVGLLLPVGKGTGCRLVMRQKAVRQEPDPIRLVRLMAHVLMWRKDQRGPSGQTREQRADFWRAWVEERRAFSLIGRSVRGRMRQMLADALEAQRVAEARAAQLAGAAEALKELGVTPGYDRWQTRRRIESALANGAHETLTNLRTTIDHLSNLHKQIEALSR